MDIGDVAGVIKIARTETTSFRRHFKEMIEERELKIEEIQNTWETAKIVGITHQGEDIYKVVFVFKNDKDLNIIVGISEEEKSIRFIGIPL